MKPIKINVARGRESAVAGQPITLGIPLPRGCTGSLDELCLHNQAEDCIPCDLEVSQRWPDGSLKWILLRFVLDEDTVYACLSLQPPGVQSQGGVIAVTESSAAYSVSVGECQFVIDRSGNQALPAVNSNGRPLWTSNGSGVELLDNRGEDAQFEVDEVVLGAVGRACMQWTVTGHFQAHDGRRVSIELQFALWASAVLVCHCSIHNGSRAEHAGGLWDLGDSGSFDFREFKIKVEHHSAQASIKSTRSHAWQEFETTAAIELSQLSSGGAHRDSPVHVDASGDTADCLDGYQLTIDGEVVEQGERCEPVVDVLGDPHGQYQTAMRDFWQNFPAACRYSAGSLEWYLFPSGEKCHELQGGERKGQEMFFSFGADRAALEWVECGAVVSLAPQVFQQAGILRYFPQACRVGEYEELLQRGLSLSEGFVAKREAVDEYGWRHFGEVYADHETAFHDGDEIFVSHYNNQYDPIYGFARQWMVTADPRWYELMRPLARHVLDIDIYRTSLDRAEYNHGLFWHTDHYKKAFTCTHRTFSRQQYSADWDGNMGGGPGPEHCYTAGMKLYALLSGDRDSADTVVGMTEWITRYYEGSGTLIEQCKRAGADVKTLLSLLKGQKLFRYHYPFNRGVGNYIRALLDSYELTDDASYIRHAEQVIRNTFGPADDIGMRNLHDVERTWFYTVFLQEIIYYLHVKRERGELDEQFDYVRQSLLHYANWMVENEQPSLAASELEYPNDTWVAQDIRKVEIFYAAHCLGTVNRDRYLERAKYFRDYVLSTLQQSSTAHYARIQIILLQNHGPSGLLDQQVPAAEFNDIPIKDNCIQGVGQFVRYLSGQWIRAVFRFNPRREAQWLKTRMS